MTKGVKETGRADPGDHVFRYVSSSGHASTAREPKPGSLEKLGALSGTQLVLVKGRGALLEFFQFDQRLRELVLAGPPPLGAGRGKENV
jgi:hypothetical protein